MKTSNTKDRLTVVLTAAEVNELSKHHVGPTTWKLSQSGPFEFHISAAPNGSGSSFSVYPAGDKSCLSLAFTDRAPSLRNRYWGMSEVEQVSIRKDGLLFVPDTSKLVRKINKSKPAPTPSVASRPVTLDEFRQAVETINLFSAQHDDALVLDVRDGQLRAMMEF